MSVVYFDCAGDDAFSHCNNLTVKGYEGSYAETYAGEHRIPFEVMEETASIAKPGAANCDGSIDVSDAVLLARFCTEDSTAVITDQGMQNADMTQDGNIDSSDVTAILRKIARID